MTTYMTNGEQFTCPVEATTNIIGKKWVPRIMMALKEHPYRFEALRTEITASRKVLKQQLDMLIDNDLVVNTKTESNHQVTSEYALTATGQQLADIIDHLKAWGSVNLECYG